VNLLAMSGDAGRILRLGGAVDRLQEAMRCAVADTAPRRVTDVYVTERLLGILTSECDDALIDRIVVELDQSAATVGSTTPPGP
jgi:hypothetical protein